MGGAGEMMEKKPEKEKYQKRRGLFNILLIAVEEERIWCRIWCCFVWQQTVLLFAAGRLDSWCGNWELGVWHKTEVRGNENGQNG